MCAIPHLTDVDALKGYYAGAAAVVVVVGTF